MKLVDLFVQNSDLFQLLSENARVDFLRNKYVEGEDRIIIADVFNRLVDADPTSNKKYLTWIINQYIKNVAKVIGRDKLKKLDNQYWRAVNTFTEDLPTLESSLSLFDRYKNKYPKKDINQYSIPELNAATVEVEDKLTDDEKAAPGEHRFSADESKFPEYKIGKVEGFTVWKMPQKDNAAEGAACELGQNTSWCTRNGAFKTYNRRDPLYIFIGRGTKYQFHFSDNQFKDRVDGDMKNGPLKDAFLKFLEDYEGRVQGTKDISSYKVGEYDSPKGKLPLYKIGKDKYYTSIDGQEVFYNPDQKLLKTKQGQTISNPATIFSHPYMDFLKEVYRRYKADGDIRKFHSIYRLLLDLDVPQRGLDEWWVLNDLNLEGAKLDKLPEGLHIKGDLNITGSNIKELPKRIKVDGKIINSWKDY